MFYSHEILTSRKYGVATVWLVATLGSRSGMKKINRKEIQNVDISKACGTITAPEAPMALRLQSSLLYGVSRVYDQQCSYVLVDAQAAQSQMRALLKVVRSSELDTHAGEARPEQLVLQDDPEFLPEMMLPSLDISLQTLDLLSESDSHQNSMLSHDLPPKSSDRKAGGLSGLALMIPSSTSKSIGDVGGFSLRDSSIGTGQHGMTQNPILEEDGFDPHVGFNFDPDGNMIEVGAQPTELPDDARRVQPRIRSSSAVSARVRHEHAEGNVARYQDLDNQTDMDLNIGGLQGRNYDLPEMSDHHGMIATPQSQQHISPIFRPDQPEPDAAAVQQRSKPRPQRSIPADVATQMRNSEISAWSTHYPANMAKASKSKLQRRMAIARANATYFVFGSGLGGIGNVVGSAALTSPLAVFVNDSLLEALHGGLPLKRKLSRSLSDADLADDERRVRPRSSDEAELGRGVGMVIDDNEMPLLVGDESIELPRNALPLPEDPSSVMPWNQATVLPPSRAGSTIHYPTMPSSTSAFPPSARIHSSAGLSLGRRASRLPSASPLHGRGTHDILSDPAFPGEEGNWQLNSDEGEESDLARASFQLFGAAAGVDTQTADDSQWMKAAMNRESDNFLDFVKAELERLAVEDVGDGRGGVVDRNHISFEKLLPPTKHTSIVAAQAFLHILTLATKGVLQVEQASAFGDINMALERN